MKPKKLRKCDIVESVKREEGNVCHGCPESPLPSESNASHSDLGNSHLAESLAGRIDTLQMINFMCHANLEIKFNDRITFITGLNGSGKSTIMVALVVVLGGTAHVTGRGKGLGDFIKKGEKWAKIVVTLLNEGRNAYKTSLYGDRIIIIRDLTVRGGNSYTCKSKYGRVISKKKDEVDKICAALNIQIKNPICILNQDVARSFLATSDANVRYDIFMRATQLEKIHTLYTTATQLLITARKILATKKEEFVEAGKTLNEMKEYLEYVISLKKVVRERRTLGFELLWSYVIVEERNLEHLRSKKADTKQMLKICEDSRNGCDAAIDELKRKIKKCEKKLSKVNNALSSEEGTGREKKKELELEIRKMQSEIYDANEEERKLCEKCQNLESEINITKTHVNELKKISGFSSEDVAKIKSNIASCRNRLSDLNEEKEKVQESINSGSEKIAQYRMNLGFLKSELKELEAEKNRIELKQKNTDNPLLKFGPVVMRLDELIEKAARNRQFVKKPIGPCCKYVTINDFKWARAVESVVGGLMGTYCCDNTQDFHCLTRLMKRAYDNKTPPVIISRFQNRRHDVSARKVSVPGMKTVLDVLDISNDVVYNTFIDQARLETLLLFESDSHASALLSKKENVPKHLRMGLTINSDRYYPAPKYRTYFGNNKGPLIYFDEQVAGREAREKLEQDLTEAKAKVAAKIVEIENVKSTIERESSRIVAIQNRLKSLKETERKTAFEIRDLEEQLKDSQVELPRRKVLKSELEVLKEKKKELEEALNNVKLKAKGLLEEKKRLTEAVEEIFKARENLNLKKSQLQEKLNVIKMNLDGKIRDRSKVENDIKEKLSELKTIRKEIKRTKKLLGEKTEAAMEAHQERINTSRSPQLIQELIKKCRVGLRVAAKTLSNAKKLGDDYRKKCERFKQIKSKLNMVEDGIDKMWQQALSKKEIFKQHHRRICSKISFHFQAFLKMRGYDGNLIFDSEEEKLEIEFMPRTGPVRKDTKTLSGGERSYLMVSLIMAIWRTVDIPFYFLDEFDVFMDKVNRKVIMDLLLMHGEIEKDKQFMFITPQNVSAVRTSKEVSIFRMPDPVRKAVK